MADWLQFDPSNLPWLRREGEAAREATSAFQFGANLALQRRKLALEEQQSVLEYRKAQAQISNLALRNKLESQLLDDSLADKETMAEAIPKRNALPLEQRLEMPVPPFKTTAAFNQWNTLVDNDRMAYERSVAGQYNTAKAKMLGAVPDLAQDYFEATNPDERQEILKQIRQRYLDQFKPQEMTTKEGERLVFNPKSGAFRFAPEAVGDEVVTRPITDETGEVIGHAMRSGDKWVRIPESRQQSRFEEIKYRGLQKQLDDIVESKSLTTNEKRIKAFEAQEAKIRAEMQAIESRTTNPAPQTKALPKIGEIRDGYEYIGPNPGDPNSWRKVQ